MDIKKIIDTAIKAGRAILEVYNSEDFGVEQKADNSPLTKADKAAHRVIMEGLNDTGYPVLSEEGAAIPYEERKRWNKFWLVDPLDGTKEFIKRNGEFTVNIALIENGKPLFGVVYVPVTDTLYWGSVGAGAFKAKGSALDKAEAIHTKQPGDILRVVASRSHLNEETRAYIERFARDFKEVEFTSKGSSLKLVEVAEGNAHLYPRIAPTMEWDTAAAHAIVLAAGGSVNQLDNTPLVYNKEHLLNPYFVVKSRR
jgi:3'(2'), 5'-bisphosphate nucleotidase